jgi:hypothetical protein
VCFLAQNVKDEERGSEWNGSVFQKGKLVQIHQAFLKLHHQQRADSELKLTSSLESFLCWVAVSLKILERWVEGVSLTSSSSGERNKSFMAFCWRKKQSNMQCYSRLGREKNEWNIDNLKRASSKAGSTPTHSVYFEQAGDI